MGLKATVQLGRVPHPSIALVASDWLKENGMDSVAYVRLKAVDKDLGVLRVLDSGVRSLDEVFVDPRAWLSRVPEADTEIQLEAANKEQYAAWRKSHTKLRRDAFWASLCFTLVAGIIQLSWDVGKYWTWWHPNNFWAGLSQIFKWMLIGLGVTGIAAFREYRSIE